MSLKKTYSFFFLLGLFFLPFNSEPPSFMGFLGEYSRESSPLFFLIGIVLLIANDLFRGKLYLPFNKAPYNVFVVFLLVIFLSAVVNASNITGYYFKQTNGWNRYINQFISVLLSSVMFFYLFCNVIKDYGVVKVFMWIRKTFFYSLLIVAAYAFFEYLAITYNLEFSKTIVYFFDYLPFVKVKLDYNLGRISSLTYEPPALGMYLVTISGFMFSYILTSKKNYRFIPFFIVVLLTLLSKSRSAFVIILVQISVAIFYTYMVDRKFRGVFNKILIVAAVLFASILVFKTEAVVQAVNSRIQALNFADTKYSTNSYSVSNKSRLGIQYANYQVFLENPIFGVGWGQQAYESKDKYPKWATKNNYEFPQRYLNENIKSFPPGYNLYLRTLTETGLIGFTVFAAFMGLVFYYSLQFIKKIQKEHKYIPLAMLIAFVGFFLNWLQIDSFRIYGFWLCLSLVMHLKKQNKNVTHNSFNTSFQ